MLKTLRWLTALVLSMYAQMVDGVDQLYRTLEYDQVKVEGTKVTFQLVNSPMSSGSFKCAFRLFPKNADLPHRMDFCYVRWF